MADLAQILHEAKEQGIDLSDRTDEIVAKFAYCVSERILKGETSKKAIANKGPALNAGQCPGPCKSAGALLPHSTEPSVDFLRRFH